MDYQIKLKWYVLGTLFWLMPLLKANAQGLPHLGSEIYLEPGQSFQDIDNWVRDLADSGMPIARVFMMWNYIEPKPGVWDFAQYDTLFKAAERYGVKITPTLVPNSPPFFTGKDFFYRTHIMEMFPTQKLRDASKEYIQKVVNRYKNSPALDTWWLYNEPSGYPENDTFAIAEFRKWLALKYHTIEALNKAWQAYFADFDDITYDQRWSMGGWVWQAPFYDWCHFWRRQINDQIAWLRAQVEKYDKKHPFTTNPPGVFNSLAYYDLPGMGKAVDILGASLHPSWFFSWVPRYQYGLAISWQNDLLHGVTGEKPYWISELQGGSNWHSQYPLDPSPDDIAQWVWTSLGSGASRVIFWLLNARMQGNESTEWALLDFQQKPSNRMKKAAEIAHVVQDHKAIFWDAKPVSSPITIIVSPLTLLMQDRKQNRASSLDAVKALAHQKAAMACYNALMEQGIPVQLKIIDAFDWNTEQRGQVAILPDVMALTAEEIKGIKAFIHGGNKVVVTGLTGLYDEHEKSWIVNREFPLEDALGGTIQDILSDTDSFAIKLDGYGHHQFPAQLCYSVVLPENGKVIGQMNGKPIALSHRYGKGSVLWIPSMISMGAWAYGDSSLAYLLKHETRMVTSALPFSFESFHQNCYMHTLKSSHGYITVIVNENNHIERIHINTQGPKKASVIYGKGWDASQAEVTMRPNGTVVLYWE